MIHAYIVIGTYRMVMAGLCAMALLVFPEKASLTAVGITLAVLWVFDFFWFSRGLSRRLKDVQNVHESART